MKSRWKNLKIGKEKKMLTGLNLSEAERNDHQGDVNPR
jgi:hypothetical protein